MASALTSTINIVANIITLVIFINALLSFAPIDPWHPVRRFFRELSDPIVDPIRRIMPQTGMIDLSPMVALFAIQILAQVLIAIVNAALR